MATPDITKANKNSDYKVIGTRPIRHDGVDKVMGRARYSADITLPGLLFGKILRSPHAHARIKSIDPSRALAFPGVKAVVTSADLPQISGKVDAISEGGMVNLGFLSDNCLARDKALYKGHALAAVVATSPHIAEEALLLIDVDYDVLPCVTDGLEAMKENAPILHERLAKLTSPSIRAGGLLDDDSISSEHTNIGKHFAFDAGDMEEGWKAADLIVEQEFRTAAVHQGYIEPQSVTALWNPDGLLTLWCSSQGHFMVRDQTASILGIPVSKVKVVPMEIGGGFGGKTLVYIEPVAALLAKKTGHPVKLTLTRSEVFEGTGPTPGTYVRVKMGASKKGLITAVDATLVYEAGAYPGAPVGAGAQCMFAPYNIPNGHIEGYDVVVNSPKTAAYRAPGSTPSAFAVETVIDEICEKLAIDPLEFRHLNGAKEGTRRITGPKFPPIGYLELVEAAKSHPHYVSTLDGSNRGRGVASGFWLNGSGPASATASVNADGTISLVEGSPDIGGTRSTAAMQLAEVLGISAEDVCPMIGDTDSIGYTSMTGGSSVTFKTGYACYEAAQDIVRQMVQRAAVIWEVDPGEVTFAKGVFTHNNDPALRLSFKELAAKLNGTGGPIVGRATVDPKGVGSSFALHIVDVEVDPETGKTTILRYTALQDVGKAIHPSYVEGQMQGGAVQGIGWALNEEYFYTRNGHMANASFLDYRMPTSLDLPMIDTQIVEVPNPGHPFGVKGVGEVSIVPPPAAIANAIYRAIGVRMRRLPMSPGRVLEGLWELPNA